MATRAATGQHGAVKASSLDFYYKTDAKARFLDLKNQWQSKHRGEISLNQADEMAQEAYSQASVETPFSQWLFHGGPDPRVFTGKLHLYNSSTKALLNVPLSVTLRAKVGELRVNPEIQMTDYDHLDDTARWEDVSSKTITIPALAPGEDMLVEVARFRLLDFLARHPNQWPSQVMVQVNAPQMGSTRKIITLVPDHFVVPVLY